MYSVDLVRITIRCAIVSAVGGASGESIVFPSCTLISGPTIAQMSKHTNEYSAVKMLIPLKHLAVGLQNAWSSSCVTLSQKEDIFNNKVIT